MTTATKELKLNVDFINGYIYKDNTLKSDCTNNGASSRFDRLYVVAEHVTVEQVEELCKNNPYYNIDQFFKLDYEFYYSHDNYCRLQPLNKGNKWYMFGGNYLASSDSRFKEYVKGCKYPIPILDRYEGNNIQD